MFVTHSMGISLRLMVLMISRYLWTDIWPGGSPSLSRNYMTWQQGGSNLRFTQSAVTRFSPWATPFVYSLNKASNSWFSKSHIPLFSHAQSCISCSGQKSKNYLTVYTMLEIEAYLWLIGRTGVLLNLCQARTVSWKTSSSNAYSIC